MQVKPGFTVQWHITDKCNLNCTHCYRDEKTEELPLEHLKAIADTVLEGMRVLNVSPCFALSGGEPLLRKDLVDLIEYLYQQGVTNILLETNGTLIDNQVVHMLTQHSPPITTIQVSLDGSTPSVHDPIRGKGTFKKAVAGLNRIRKDTNLYTTISYTFHSKNVEDIPFIIQLGEHLGVDALYLTRLVPIGRGKRMNVLTPEKTKEVLTFLHQKNKEFKSKGKPKITENRCLFHLTDPEEAVNRYRMGGERLGNACAVASSTFTILSDGTAVPCRRLPIPLANLLEQSFLDIWFKNDVLWDFRRRQKLLKGKCKTCPFLQYKGLCDGGAACIAYGYSNDYNNPDPQCWYNPEEP
jgi:radical SAM protein with 4Fe4S-binding SPASM domain